MDIFNRPPAISEDTLQYIIYPPPGISDKASVTTFAACIRTFVDGLLPNFIWHRDSFEAKVVPNPDNEDAWLVEGRMRVGDCVDDEWCTVWLLREISGKWDLVISVFDSDGEFLLIEAAEALPSWVKPTNTENRVWIYNSRLHLVPISHISPPSRKRRHRRLPASNEDDDADDENINDEDSDDFITAEDAVKLVRDPSVNTFAPPAVEKIVWRRISGYPTAARNHVHHTRAYIPIDIARSLVTNPSLVQKAVEAFYTRDAIQLRAAHRMTRFPPQSSVLSTVKMTRTAYAQLIGQKFFPPKVFGHWQEPEGTKEWRWRDVGMKIAVGFEMLYQESKGRSAVSSTNPEANKSSSEAKKDALRRNPEYIKYIQNLVSADYFRGEIEGSELWKVFESKAADIFVEVRREDDATRESFAAQVNAAVSDLSLAPASQIEEDSDDWLNINAQDFETMLEQTMGASKPSGQSDAMDVDSPKTEEAASERLASQQAAKLKELAAKVENFVEGEGDLEGAKFEDEEFSDEPFSDEESPSGSEAEELPLDMAARQAAMDKLIPGLEPSDYGKMPPLFHSGSQRVASTTIESETIEQAPSVESKSQSWTKPIREPIISRDRYEGVDSDDETDEEVDADDESDEDRPQVIGDIDVDMKEEEEEFLEFSRQALGISDEQWKDIVRDRKERGAFLPANTFTGTYAKKTTIPTNAENQPQGRTPAPGPRPNINPALDSFEAVMEAMDVELARLRPSLKKTGPSPKPSASDVGKGKGKAIVEDVDEDIEAAMDAELKAALEREEGGGDDEDEELPDYALIKNFLESFKSQAGLSGPVSNLAGRLQPGWQLPRDDS
ncbi:Protein ecdysoneless [Hypsizygus marmoreus]|uniref:Protein ecdysoneless n=1 Tax=Hypsizygus marmoreus TaxID=39966 RepID=A0A369KAW4_HYPMA|nr:Protein ecdysoneless [Hypsizygus marmoreus]